MIDMPIAVLAWSISPAVLVTKCLLAYASLESALVVTDSLSREGA